jgi:hypothetical protein
VEKIWLVSVVFGGKIEATNGAMACARVGSFRGTVGVDAARHGAASRRIFFRTILAYRELN